MPFSTTCCGGISKMDDRTHEPGLVFREVEGTEHMGRNRAAVMRVSRLRPAVPQG
jgi:hypothetical protein